MSEKSPTIKLKEGIEAVDLLLLTPKMIVVLGHMAAFCQARGLDCLITNITGRFKESVSNTHREGRAVDVSIRNFRIDDIKDAQQYMETVIGHYGAISASDHERRVFVYHDIGRGKHIHLQVSR